jgi:uncharacterized protein
MNKNILITGGTGFIGRNLINSLLSEGNNKITVITRDIEKAKKIDGFEQIEFLNSIDMLNRNIKYHIIINLAGASIADKKWSTEQKNILIKSRTKITRDIVNYISEAKQKPDLLISASAIGFYGFHNRRVFSERSTPMQCFASHLCKKWEREANLAKKHTRVAIIRLGVVFDKNGGMLKKLLPSFKLGLGAIIGNGKQYMSWIHMDDVISIINYLINQHDSQGIYNLTSPVAITNEEFSGELSKSLNRPCFMKLPSFIIKLMFGQMGEELLLGSQNVMPQRLLSLGYEFKYPHLKQAFSDIFK